MTFLNSIIIEFLTFQLWLGNIHLSWDAVINMIRLGGLTCSLKSFVQLNMCQVLHIFAAVCMYWECRLSLVRLCDSDFGITPVDDITIGITRAAFLNYYYYYYYYYYHHHHHHRISHFSALAGKYSPILGCSNQND